MRIQYLIRPNPNKIKFAIILNFRGKIFSHTIGTEFLVSEMIFLKKPFGKQSV